MVRCRVVVSGRVQGVWYRESCRREADALGVGGWIRNNRDGTVEALLEGQRADVDKLLSWMRVGPRLAVVTNIAVHDEPASAGAPPEPGFAVR